MSDTLFEPLIDATADIVRGVHGIRLEVMPGADRYGFKGYAFTPINQLNHHTGRGSYAALRDYIHHGASAAPLSQILTSDPRKTGGVCIVTVIASGRCNHAGRGSGLVPHVPADAGNRLLLGLEHQNDGVEPWDPWHLEVQAILNAGYADAFGWSVAWLADHKTYAPDRKVDRHSIDIHAWRRRVTALTGRRQMPDHPLAIVVRSPNDEGQAWPLKAAVDRLLGLSVPVLQAPHQGHSVGHALLVGSAANPAHVDRSVYATVTEVAGGDRAGTGAAILDRILLVG